MTTVNAPIVAVTVFMNRARITRRGVVHLAAGEQALSVTNLPVRMDPESIRASGSGANVKILGVEVQTRYADQTPHAATAALEEELDTLRQMDKVLDDETAQHSDRYEMLKKLHENVGVRFAKGLATGKATVESLRPVDQYLNDELNAMYARQREIDKQRQELAKRISAAEARLQQAQSSAGQTWQEVVVNVEALAETDLTLDVTYAVTGASWTPLYDMRLTGGQVNLTYLAQIKQESGEDWPAVELSLSTARLAGSYTIPKLTPWYIDRYLPPAPHAAQPRSVMAAAPLPAMLKESAADATFGALPEPAPVAEVEEAVIGSEGAAVTYRVARPVAVPSDGSLHKTTITTLILDAQLDYVAVPKIAQEVYMRARINNVSNVMLLPGIAQIFRGDDYVGNMALKRSIAPTEEFEAQLGLEESIKVERELIERNTTRNLVGVGNLRRITIGYKLKVANNLPETAHVLIFDQLPVPRDESIKVRLQDAQPKPTEQNELNILKWELDLPAQSKREIPFTFTLEHPRDISVSGLGELESLEY
jgi:uncharacterized protein (TIGR02231 family)